jgi:hypothetical protein
LQVDTTCGPCPLSGCFLLSPDDNALGPDLQRLTPMLTLDDVTAEAAASWTFLQQLGVSTTLGWEAIWKLLRQLSADKMAPSLGSMARLYKRVEALVGVGQDCSEEEVRAAFEKEPLIFLTGTGGVGGSNGAEGVWVCSDEVLWEGDTRVCAHKIFIKPFYPVSARFESHGQAASRRFGCQPA